MNHVFKKTVLAALISYVGCASAFTFETESISGNFDSTVTTGIGIRAKNPSCNLVVSGASGAGAPVGCLAPTSALGDQGNLNYGKGDAFTTYLKGSHELLLKMPESWTFMGRVGWLK